MSELFLSNTIGGILNKLTSIEIRKTGFEEDLKKLHYTLDSFLIYVSDTEAKAASSSESRKFWLKRLKDVCYAINDVVDEFELVALRKQVIGPITSFFSSNPLIFRLNMRPKIKEINWRLDANEISRPSAYDSDEDWSLRDYRRRYGLNKEDMFGRPRTISYLQPNEVFGREREKEQVLKLLLDKGEGEGEYLPDVLSIVGMGGLGKTTLAQLVYNDVLVDEHFELKIWISVSNDFDVHRIIRSITESGTGTSFDPSDLDLLTSRLRHVLRPKRFLIVLDDVWNEDPVKWEQLKSALVGGAKGSKIIVTTRSRRVAAIVGTLPPHYLSCLSHEESMSLFKAYAFPRGVHYPEHVSIGEDIVRKCGGLPLAIKVVASSLCTKETIQEWLDVRDSEAWSTNGDNDGTQQVLRLSYNQLPSQLKQCFALLSAFPKDSTIMSTTLICRWIAHGIFQSNSSSENLEQIGKSCIDELFFRSFIDLHDCGYYSIIRMHDLNHDLALAVAEDEHMVVEDHETRLPRCIRHLTFRDADAFSKQGGPSCLEDLKDVLTVTHFHKVVPTNFYVKLFISRFKSLRVLYLRKSCITNLPANIRSLKFLRLLDLSCNEHIKQLPNSICKLYALQTLSLYRCVQLETLPKDFGNLISLRFLHLTTQDTCFSGKVFKKLASLRQLYISDCYNLKYLFDDDHDGEIQIQSGIHSLGIYNCTNLLQLPRGLKFLTALENLAIYECRKLGLNMNIQVDGGLKSLQYLGIGGLPKLVALPDWLVQSASNTLRHVVILGCYNFIAFPQTLTLSRLCLENCPQLTSLPKEVNCRASLQELVVTNCPELVRRCERKKGQDWKNIASIPNIYLDGVKIQSGNNNQSSKKQWFESSSLLLMMEGIKDLEASVY